MIAPDIGVLNEDSRLYHTTGNQCRMLYLQNRSGETVETGDVVVLDTTSPRSFRLTTKENDPLVIGVVAYELDASGKAKTQTIPNLAWGWIQNLQRCTKVKSESFASIGNFLQTSQTKRFAKPSTAQEENTFGIALTEGYEVEALLGVLPSALPAPTLHWKVLAEIETTANSGSVTFTGLDLNADWFYALFVTLENTAGEPGAYYLYVSGDSWFDYYSQYILADDVVISTMRDNRPTVFGLDTADTAIATIFMTKDPGNYFRFYSVVSRNAAIAVELISASCCRISPIENVTSLKFVSERPNGIGAGSRFLLCKPRP